MTNGSKGWREGENLYWRYDKWIKGLESRLGSTVAADGSLYAIRRSLFVPITDAAQADDLAISARVVTQGFRLIFEPKAISYEHPPSSLEQEFWRKVRVTNHSVRAIMRLAPALRPWRHSEYLIKLLSHKVLRYSVPFLMLITLGSNIALAPTSWFFAVLLGLQLAFYGLAASAYRLRDSERVRLRLFYIPLYFCLANAAAFLGVLSVLRGDRITAWQPQRDNSNETQESINIQEYRKRAS